MKRKIFFKASLLLVAGMLAACSSNDDNKENNGTRNGKIDVTKAVEFKVDFADYNDNGETDMTRTNSNGAVLQQQTVNLGNGILALCTLQRDTTKQAKPATTRTLPDDTYTMLAYDHTTHAFKGEVTGTITGGVFRYSGDKAIELEPGTYDFVLFNSKLQRNGNNLTVTRANASDAFIGRTTQAITATPYHQLVPFTMKHAAAKVKIKLTGYMNFPAVTAHLYPFNVNGFAIASTYDASTATWQAAQRAIEYIPLTFNAATAATGTTYVSTSNEEVYFTPKTETGLIHLYFDSGTIYQQNMPSKIVEFKDMELDPNGAYVLNIKLMYNFLYLMSDGTTGFFQETTYGGGEKTPIGLVFSQSRRLAMALKDASNGPLPWDGSTGWQPAPGDNTTLFYTPTDMFNDMDGYKWTWDPNGTYDHTTIKANSSRYPAFYAAGHYTPTLPTGVNLTGSIVGKHWHLPSHGEWKLAVGALGFGDISNLNAYHISRLISGYLWDIAFTQVGGDVLCRYGTKRYWTSTEDGHYNIPILEPNPTYMRMLETADTRTESNYIRPVIIY